MTTMLRKIVFASFIALISNFTSAKYKVGEDITTYLNNQLRTKSNVKIPAGNYKINADKSIILRDNVNLTLDPKTTLTLIPSRNGNYQAFKIHNVKNVKISGGTLIGDKYNHLGEMGEWGMGIEIKDSQNISISNMSINKMWGDAIYIGSNGKHTNYNIKLSNLKMDDNRRQGLSLISVKKLRASNLVVTNTNGTSPGSGIDIEPNNAKSLLEDIEFRDIKTMNNRGAGFQITLKEFKNSNNLVDIKVINHQDIGSNFGSLIDGIDHTHSGKISFNTTNYTKNRILNNCFSDWENPQFNIEFTQTHYDKSNGTSKWCQNVKANKNIVIK